MGFDRTPGLSLRATLCEVERGLFQITYRAGPGERFVGGLPTYQVARSVADAKRQIEAQARAFDLETIIWDLGPGLSDSPLDLATEMMSPVSALAVGN